MFTFDTILTSYGAELLVTVEPDVVWVEVVACESSTVAGEDFECEGSCDIFVWAVCVSVEIPVGSYTRVDDASIMIPDSGYDESATACDTEAHSMREYYSALPYGAVYAGHTLGLDGCTIGSLKSVCAADAPLWWF